MAGTIFPVQFGWRVQMGSTMSNMSNAVVAGLRTTGTGSGGDGICSVGGDLVMVITRLRRSLPAHAGDFFLRRREKVVDGRDKPVHYPCSSDCPYFPFTTFCFCSPSPSMPSVTTSPAFKNVGSASCPARRPAACR